MRNLIGIFRDEFIEFCNFTRPATHIIRNSTLSHEARCFLFLIRFCQDLSIHVLGAFFRVSHVTAMNYYDDILFWLLMNDPNVPCIWNDETATEEEIEALLTRIQEAQSEGIR